MFEAEVASGTEGQAASVPSGVCEVTMPSRFVFFPGEKHVSTRTSATSELEGFFPSLCLGHLMLRPKAGFFLQLLDFSKKEIICIDKCIAFRAGVKK